MKEHQNGRSQTQKPELERIVVHVRPHLDELMAIWLIKRFGHDTWRMRGGQVKVAYVENDEDAKALAAGSRGTILVGVGGGRYDEHKAGGRDKRECAATLVARDIKDARGRGIDGQLEIGHLLRETMKADKGEAKGFFSFPTIINRLQRKHVDSAKVLEFAFAAFDACYEDLVKYYRDCKAAFAGGTVRERNGLRAVAVASDLDAFNAYARTRQGANVVFQRGENGNVAVFTDERGAKVLPALVRGILREEMKRAGEEGSFPEAEKVVDGIERKGAGRDLPAASHWYYHVECSMLLNGSKSKPGIPATRLSKETLLRLFEEAADSQEAADKRKLTLVASA